MLISAKRRGWSDFFFTKGAKLLFRQLKTLSTRNIGTLKWESNILGTMVPQVRCLRFLQVISDPFTHLWKNGRLCVRIDIQTWTLFTLHKRKPSLINCLSKVAYNDVSGWLKTYTVTVLRPCDLLYSYFYSTCSKKMNMWIWYPALKNLRHVTARYIYIYK